MEKETIKKVPQHKLGSQGLVVSSQGLGAMGMTAFYENSQTTEDEKIEVFGKALELGINFVDTAWIYQNFKTGETNEGLVGKALKKYGRENFVVATKFAIYAKDGKLEICGKPDFVRAQCEESLKRLDIECIDLYYMHRMDPTTPIEETMKCLLELKKEGKIKYVGLSECTAEELERAHKVFPISAIQMEWSLNTRDSEHDIIPAARKLGVGIVAYSPLGRGLLSRTITKKEDIAQDDYRQTTPRFQGENLEKNLGRLEKFEEYAKNKGYSAGQLALAWVHNQGNDVFPIPGTKSSKRIEENAKASFIILSKDEIKEIQDIVGDCEGERYNEESIKYSHNARKSKSENI